MSDTTYKAARTKPATQTAARATTPAPQRYLGPGRVTSVHGAGVDVHLSKSPEHVVTARMALAQPYEPLPGDELLLIGEPDGYYVIGVLAGHGQTELRFNGDVRIHASGGKLELSGDTGLKLESPEVTVAAGEVKTFARTVTEKVDTAYRWVRERLSVRAGSVQRVVEGEDLTRAKNSVTLAEEVVKLDGGSVQLGH
jgi:hypothetical protein